MPSQVEQLRESIKRRASQDTSSAEALDIGLRHQFEVNFPDIEVDYFTMKDNTEYNPDSPLRLTGELSKLSYLISAASKSLWEYNGRTTHAYAADAGVLMRYPQLDPSKVYSVADAEIKSRIQNLYDRAPNLSEEARKELYDHFNPQGADENKTKQFFEDLDNYGKQVRRLDRMIQICGDDPDFAVIRSNLMTQRHDMISGKNYPLNFERHLKFIEAMEIVAGIREPIETKADAPLNDPDVMRKTELENSLNIPLKPAVQKNEYVVNGYDTKYRFKAHEGLMEENWGKPQPSWSITELLDEDNPKSYSLLRGYAEGLGKGPLSASYPADSKDARYNPLNTVMIDGVTARERMMRMMREEAADRVRKEKGVRQPAQKDIDNAYLLLLQDKEYCRRMTETAIGIGLMSGASIFAINVNRTNGKVDIDNVMEIKSGPNGYHPDPNVPEERPVIKGWQRFLHWAFGAFKDKYAQVEAFDRREKLIEEAREQALKLRQQNENSRDARETTYKTNTGNTKTLNGYQANLNMMYGSAGSNTRGAGNVVRGIRKQATASFQPYNPNNDKLTNDEYSALTLASATHIDFENRVYGEGKNRDGRWGSFWANASEDVINDRENTDLAVSPKILDEIHTRVRNTLCLKPTDHSPEAEARRVQLQEGVTRFVRGALNSNGSLTPKNMTYFTNVARLGGVLEKRPDLLGGLPEDVKQGIKVAENLVKMEERVIAAKVELSGNKTPTPAQAKELYMDIAMERYVDALLHKNGNNIRFSNKEYADTVNAMNKANDRNDELNEISKTRPLTQEEQDEQLECSVTFAKNSIASTGLELNAYASAVIPDELLALATPGALDLLRAGMSASKVPDIIQEEMEDNSDYMSACYAAAGHQPVDTLNNKIYDALPKPMELKKSIENKIEFKPASQTKVQTEAAPEVPKAKEQAVEQPKEQAVEQPKEQKVYFGFELGEVPDYLKPGYAERIQEIREKMNQPQELVVHRGMDEWDAEEEEMNLTNPPKQDAKQPEHKTMKK